MDNLNRRSFNKETLGSLLTISLLETAFAKDAFKKEMRPLAKDWLAELDVMSHDLRDKQITQIEWQKPDRETIRWRRCFESLEVSRFRQTHKGCEVQREG